MQKITSLKKKYFFSFYFTFIQKKAFQLLFSLVEGVHEVWNFIVIPKILSVIFDQVLNNFSAVQQLKEQLTCLYEWLLKKIYLWFSGGKPFRSSAF